MTHKTYIDPNPNHWDDYSNLQRVKHELIRKYLNGWLPILGLQSGRIVYIDAYAGRGRYRQDELGSPLVALNTFLDHNFRDRILERCEVVFWFIENDEKNYESLTQEISQIGPLPSNITVDSQFGDCITILRDLIESLNSEGNQLAPAFIFVDPYGFKIPGNILRELMKFPKVELFVNVMWRYLYMALANKVKETGMIDTLNMIFDGSAWQTEITAKDFEKKAEQTIGIFKKMIQAKWATSAAMLGENNMTKYMLVHYTNHNKGRDLMKRCFWNVFPDGDFRARQMDNPDQQLLFSKAPDFRPLEGWICEKLAKRPYRLKKLHELIRPQYWLETHVNKTIRVLEENDDVIASDGRKIILKSNPLLSLK